jgi:hypothetical protein
VHAKSELTCYGETTKAPLLLQRLGLANSGLPLDDHGIQNEAVFVPLDLPHHVGLGVGGAVMVNDAKTTLERHVDGHVVLSDRVHGRRDQGRLQGDLLGDGRVEGDGGGGEANVAREQQEVIVCQTTVDLGVHEVVNTQTISAVVLVEQLDRLPVVESALAGVGTVYRRHFCATIKNQLATELVDGSREGDVGCWWGETATSAWALTLFPPKEKEGRNSGWPPLTKIYATLEVRVRGLCVGGEEAVFSWPGPPSRYHWYLTYASMYGTLPGVKGSPGIL